MFPKLYIYLWEIYLFFENYATSCVCVKTNVCVCMCVGDILDKSGIRSSCFYFFSSSQIRILNLKFEKKNQFWPSHFIDNLKLRDKDVSSFPPFSSKALNII